jgi:hypothetical protein
MNEGIRKRTENDNNRLAYLLLDVFLGGFAVAFVLLIALGRPASTTLRSGSGGEEFLVVDFYWPHSNGISFAPVLKHQGISVASAGLASLWNVPSNPQGLWPAYALSTGELSGRSLQSKPFKRITVDGFDPRPGQMVLMLGTTDQRNGQIWLSMPCGGKWEIGLRVVVAQNNITAVPQVKMQLRSSGYTVKQSMSSEGVVELGVQDTIGTVIGKRSVEAVLSNAGDGKEYLHEVTLESTREMDHCTP